MAVTLDERDFQRKAEGVISDLERRLLPVSEEHDFEVENENGVLSIAFEEPQPTKFVITPNTPVRQIWVSALAQGFRLAWSEQGGNFVLDKTGETLAELVARMVKQQLGEEISL